MYLTKESLYGNSKSKFILIKDATMANGVKLLKTVAKLFHKENVKLHFIFYESIRGLDLSVDKKNITERNAVSDPSGWNNADESTINLRSLDVLVKEISEFKGVVCIDSFSPLLFHNDVSNVYRTLHKVFKENTDLQIIALMHADVHDSLENEILEKLASTVMLVTPYDERLLSTIHYSSGKVTSQFVEYKISDSFEFLLLRDVNPSVKSVVKQPDPTANLTFNLKLKDNEKEARSQLILPYMQIQNSDDILKMDEDMYEEEDPDDDLDI